MLAFLAGNFQTKSRTLKPNFRVLEILNDCIVFLWKYNIYECLYIEGRMCNTSKCAIQVNKIGLKPTYPNTH